MGSKTIPRKTETISRLLTYIGNAALFVMMCLSTADVVGRYLFNKPILGVFEITEFLMLIIIFSYLALAQSSKSHISVDILVPHLPKKIQLIIERFNHLLCLLLMVLITWMGVEKAMELKNAGEASTLLKIPNYPFAYFLVFGCLVLCLEFIADLITLFQQGKEPNES
jgi:TRAP-type C4-dicarboxylate transport system permease small subunit